MRSAYGGGHRSKELAFDREWEVEGENHLPIAVSALEIGDLEPPSFLISDFLPAGEITLLVSDGGVGKTTLALSIALAIAGGENFLGFSGFRVKSPGPVLIVSEEDGGGVLGNRLEAMVRGHGWEREKILGRIHILAQQGVRLDDPAWQEQLLAEVERIGARLVVLDPLAELTLTEEDSNSGIKHVVRFLRVISSQTGAAVLLLHHFGKRVEGKRQLDRIRGASALNAAARAIHSLERTGGGLEVECLKMSRASRPRNFKVRLEIQTDPSNSSRWAHACLTHASLGGDTEAARRLVIELLREHGTLNTSEVKEFAKGKGVSAQRISEAIKELAAEGTTRFDLRPKGAKKWYLVEFAQASSEQPGQARLPRLPTPLGQPEKGPSVVTPLKGGITDSGLWGNGQPKAENGLVSFEWKRAEYGQA